MAWSVDKLPPTHRDRRRHKKTFGIEPGKLYRGQSSKHSKPTIRFLERIAEDEDGELKAVYIGYGSHGRSYRTQCSMVRFRDWMNELANSDLQVPESGDWMEFRRERTPADARREDMLARLSANPDGLSAQALAAQVQGNPLYASDPRLLRLSLNADLKLLAKRKQIRWSGRKERIDGIRRGRVWVVADPEQEAESEESVPLLTAVNR